MTAIGPKRVGILGGAFDPPHLAHVTLAQIAIAQLQLDTLCVIPTGQAWHKPRCLTPALHRLAMVRLAFAALPQAQVDPRETLRGGPSYTIDTLRELQADTAAAQWFLIIGADQADALTSWQHWREIVESAVICVADRPNLTGVKAQFDAELAYPKQFLRLHLPPLNIDATSIRSAVASQQNVMPLVGASVARYIADHHLYLTS